MRQSASSGVADARSWEWRQLPPHVAFRFYFWGAVDILAGNLHSALELQMFFKVCDVCRKEVIRFGCILPLLMLIAARSQFREVFLLQFPLGSAPYPLAWPPFVLFSVVVVLLLFRWPYWRWHTRWHRASYVSELAAIPLLCALWFWFCCCFVFFVLFALCVVWFSMGPLTGLCIGPLPVLCWGYWFLDGIAW